MKALEYIRLEDWEKNGAARLNLASFSDIFKIEEIENINLKNCILGTITHSFDNTILPLELDAIFADKENDKCTNCKVRIIGCSNYKKKFHKELWKGYSHFALLEFQNEIPEILNLLKPRSLKKRWDTNLILCNSDDLKICEERIKKSIAEVEEFMKKKNLHIWEANKKEEQEYKERNR